MAKTRQMKNSHSRIVRAVYLLVASVCLPLSGCDRKKDYCEYDDRTGEELFCVSLTEAEFKRANAKKGVEAIAKAISYYSLDLGQIPSQEQGIAALTTPPDGIDKSRYPSHGYLENVVNDPWDSPYQYAVPARRSNDPFDVFSSGPDGEPNTDDDIGNWD